MRRMRHRRHECFNPLPPPKRGETCVVNGITVPRARFNPLPPPKRGETRKVWPHVMHAYVSIHSPRRSEGRQQDQYKMPMQKRFQSTPPAEARGDQPGTFLTWGYDEFQSTPPAEARGDARPRAGALPRNRFNPLPPPKRGETQLHLVGVAVDVVSIHSPRRSEGRQAALAPK